IRKFVLSLGITLAETKPPFEALEAFNRKIIDPVSMRLFFVRDPVPVTIQGAKEMQVTLKNHPTDASLGTRTVRVCNTVYVSGEDASAMKEGNEIRLIELYNIKVERLEREYEGSRVLSVIASVGGDEIRQSMPKIQWIAKDDIVDFKVMIPKELYIGDKYNTNSLEIASGGAESFVSTLRPGTHVQFVRFGFCSIDNQEKDTAILTHR
ncbi:MAG: glutamate--tRNA ligase, partial [Nitrososphaera sp.]